MGSFSLCKKWSKPEGLPKTSRKTPLALQLGSSPYLFVLGQDSPCSVVVLLALSLSRLTLRLLVLQCRCALVPLLLGLELSSEEIPESEVVVGVEGLPEGICPLGSGLFSPLTASVFSLEGGSCEGEEEVRGLEESSWQSDDRPVVGGIVATTSMESDEEDPVDSALAARAGLLVPTIMGSDDDSSEEELWDWALVLG